MSLGDTIEMNMTDGTKLTWVVRDVADNGDVTFSTATNLPQQRVMNSTSPGVAQTYLHTELREYLNTELFGMFPSCVKSAIKAVTRTYYLVESENNTIFLTGGETGSDKVWCPSFRQIYGDSQYNPQIYATGEDQLQYWENSTSAGYTAWFSNQNRFMSGKNYFMVGQSGSTKQGNRYEDVLYNVMPFFTIGAA